MRTRQRRMEEGTLQGQPEQGYGAMEERKPLPLRQVIFWLHLVTGGTAGLVIGMMSVTGVLLACTLRNKELRRKAVADNLDPSLIGWQALDKVVS